ncbi:hypothetical protein [Fischerella sp.]
MYPTGSSKIRCRVCDRLSKILNHLSRYNKSVLARSNLL